MNPTFLSVIVCTKNRATELLQCLPLVVEQARAFSDVEVLVVDNGSIDNTKDVTESVSETYDFRIQYIFEPVEGLCQARNRGRQGASGGVLAYIDDDVRIGERWVSNVRQHFLESRSDCLGGKVIVRLCGEMPIKGGEETLWFFGATDLGDEIREYKSSDSLSYPIGCNMVVSCTVFDTVGGFNTDLKYYCDETDFFLRVRRLDFKILYDPGVEVEHVIPAERLTIRELRRKTCLLGAGAARLWNLSNPGTLRWSTMLITGAGKSIYHLLNYRVNPTFGKFFAGWFNYSSTVQHIKLKFKN